MEHADCGAREGKAPYALGPMWDHCYNTSMAVMTAFHKQLRISGNICCANSKQTDCKVKVEAKV